MTTYHIVYWKISRVNNLAIFTDFLATLKFNYVHKKLFAPLLSVINTVDAHPWKIYLRKRTILKIFYLKNFPIYGIVDMHGNIGGDFDVLQQIHGTSIGSLYSIAHVTPKHFIQITK